MNIDIKNLIIERNSYLIKLKYLLKINKDLVKEVKDLKKEIEEMYIIMNTWLKLENEKKDLN